LDHSAGHSTRLRVYLIRPLWSLGSGWAAVGGGLAAGGFPLSPTNLLTLLLVWLLADPLLGVVWDVGAGNTRQRGIWSRLLGPRLPDAAPPVGFLPYTQAGSPGYRLAHHLGRLRRWWRDTFWPEAGREFATLLAGLGLASLLGAVLGRSVLVLVLVSVLLSWLAVLSERGNTTPDSARNLSENAQAGRKPAPGVGQVSGGLSSAGSNFQIGTKNLSENAQAGRPPVPGVRQVSGGLSSAGSNFEIAPKGSGGHQGLATLWRALGEFGVPWLIGAAVMGGPSWAIILLGTCYTITYFGLSGHARRFRLAGASQAASALLLAGLRHPMAAGAAAILLLPQWGLYTWAAYAARSSGDRLGASGPYLRYVQIFILLSMLIAGLAIAA